MAKALAVVALLGFGGAWQLTFPGLVSRFAAIVAETFHLSAGPGYMADLAALEAGTPGNRHFF
jgi:hypothetical protein